MLKWLGKTVKFCPSFVNSLTFVLPVHAMKNGWKFGQTLSRTLIKVNGIQKVCLNPKLLVFTKLCLVSTCLWPKTFTSHKYDSYLVWICLVMEDHCMFPSSFSCNLYYKHIMIGNDTLSKCWSKLWHHEPNWLS